MKPEPLPPPIPPLQPSRLPPPIPPPFGYSCPSCGEEIKKDDQFCPRCGALLVQAAPLSQSELPPTWKAMVGCTSGCLFLTVIFCAILAITGLLGAFSGNADAPAMRLWFVLFGIIAVITAWALWKNRQ